MAAGDNAFKSGIAMSISQASAVSRFCIPTPCRMTPIRRYSCLLLALGALALSACAPYQLNKQVSADPKDVQVLRQRIAGVRDFQEALYEVSTSAVDLCAHKTVREPFALISMGTMVNALPEERLAAYWEAGGIDETWRVLWTDGQVLQQGQRIVKINGKAIENNKSGLGEFPAAVYVEQTVRAREAAEKGRPYRVTLEDGTEVTVPTRPACRTMGLAIPMVLDVDALSAPINQYHPVVLPPTAIAAAASEDEFRYLAAVAVYMSASDHARQRNALSGGVLGLGASTLFINPLLYALVSQPGVQAAAAVRSGGMGLQAALFATRVVSRLGGDPRAGVALLERIERERIRATGVALPQDERRAVALLADELLAGAAQVSEGKARQNADATGR